MTSDRPSRTPDARCDALRDDLTAVATGTADGATRAAVLEHLASCDACREELSALSAAADELLLLAPDREPSADFEGRVLARMAEPSPAAGTPEPSDASRPSGRRGTPAPTTTVRRHHRGRRRVLAAVAGAGLLVAGGAAVWTATAPDRELAASYRQVLDLADGRSFTAADLVSADSGPGGTARSVGTAFLYDGDPSWAYVVVRDPGAEEAYDVVVTAGPDARESRLGACVVRDGACTAGGVLAGDASDVTSVRLVTRDGATWAGTGRPEGWSPGW
ncbi:MULTISPECIES: zf-HC2 domain-containing protein [unclassified Isoptericola]|uniref:zf-HC2 domain-containing protein n=1 Tax=unclassified Isoptericola TaxID=2623355 RepID=UPI003648472E